MPSLVKIKIVQARDLPGDLQGDASADAYVEIRLDEQHQKTTTFRKSLNPVWNEEFRFEVVDDSCLQNFPVEFKVMDQDLYSSEFIGALYLDLNPLIMRTAHGMDKDLVIQV
jgi:Ca2+-dependent lipid-binding protein